MQRYQLIDQAQLEYIHEQSMKIMREVGVDMPYEPAKELLKQHGCKVDGDRVFFDTKIVEQAIKTAPASYTLKSRDGKHDVPITCEKVSYAGPYGSPFVMDRVRGRRRSTLSDFNEIVEIVDKMDGLDLQSHISCEPSDVHEDERPLTMVYNTVKRSAKPGMASIFGYETSKACIELAAIPFGGLEGLSDPIVASIPCTLTPLSYDSRQLGAIRAYAELGQVQLINSLSIAGMTAPCTIPGQIAVQNAEVLAGITYAQLVNPGCPVVYSASGSLGEMSTGMLSIGSPEDIIVSLLNGQLCKWYQIPCRISGALSDSKTFDTQAAYESALTLAAAQAAGGNFILHSAGIIETYNCTSYEKIVADNEIIGFLKTIARPVEVDEETVPFDVIEEVGCAGQYLDQDHTFDHFREFYRPTLSDRTPYEKWEAAGAKTAEERATDIWQNIVNNFEIDIDPEIDADMRKYVEKAYGNTDCLDLGEKSAEAAA